MYDYDDFLTYHMEYAMLDHMSEEELEAARKEAPNEEQGGDARV